MLYVARVRKLKSFRHINGGLKKMNKSEVVKVKVKDTRLWAAHKHPITATIHKVSVLEVKKEGGVIISLSPSPTPATLEIDCELHVGEDLLITLVGAGTVVRVERDGEEIFSNSNYEVL